jgi:hypothetical protein
VSGQVVERLLADGLSPAQATHAYLGVHALVLGCVVIRNGGQEVPLEPLIEKLLDGIALEG